MDDRGTADAATTNLSVFESPDRVRAYDAIGGLTPAERLLVARWVAPGSRILDLGVGTGRTFPALIETASHYVGVDYASAMVRAARERYPDGDFRLGDASDLSAFGDGSFDVVVFSYNGLDYLEPISVRRRALVEIHRVLRPGGVFLMSTHNPRAVIRLPKPSGSLAKDVAVALIGSTRAAGSLVGSASFRTGTGYERDRIQHLSTYHATPRLLARELRSSGFEVVDLVAGDHPRRLRSLVSPWTYVAAIRPRDLAVTVEVVAGDLAPADAEAWDRLTAESGTPFPSRPWIEEWSASRAPSARRLTVLARDPGGEVVGLLPLALMSRSLHRWLPIPLPFVGLAGAGPDAAGHLGPLCSDAALGAVLLAEAVASAPGRSVLLEHLAERWAPVAVAAIGGRAGGTTTDVTVLRPAGGRGRLLAASVRAVRR